MLRMAQIDYIKDLYENEDLSLREISRRTGHSFQTVQKYAYQENWSAEKLPNLEAENYPNLEAENYPNLEQYIPSIDEWMEADRKLRESSGTQQCESTTAWWMSKATRAATAA